MNRAGAGGDRGILKRKIDGLVGDNAGRNTVIDDLRSAALDLLTHENPVCTRTSRCGVAIVIEVEQRRKEAKEWGSVGFKS